MEIKLLSCPLCLKPHFHGVDALRSSLISVATSQISCPVCNELLLGLDKLTIHLFSHITSQIVTNHFEIDAESQQKHPEVKSVEAVKENKSGNCCMRCDICNFCFADENILEMHQKLLHQTSIDIKTGMHSHHCHLCSKRFKMKGSLMVHLRVAHYGFGHNRGEDSCPNHCQKEDAKKGEDKTKTLVNGFLDTKNDKSAGSGGRAQDNKQWECDVCSKLFTTKYFLKKHKRLHTGEMPYFCAQCNKSFTFQQSYHKHMLYHSSEKPHVCNECGRAFKELSTLHNHERIHSGERPFACETCGKCFRQRVSYLVHRRIHTGVMPYKCAACEKSFRYKVSQRSHKCLPAATTTKDLPALTFNAEGEIIAQNFSDEIDIQKESGNKKSHLEDNHDFLSIILSPALPDVQSLCLSQQVEQKHGTNEEKQTFHTINEESLKALLYGTPD